MTRLGSRCVAISYHCGGRKSSSTLVKGLRVPACPWLIRRKRRCGGPEGDVWVWPRGCDPTRGIYPPISSDAHVPGNPVAGDCGALPVQSCKLVNERQELEVVSLGWGGGGCRTCRVTRKSVKRCSLAAGTVFP